MSAAATAASLVQRLRSRRPTARLQAAQALQDLARASAAGRLAAVDAGALPILVRLLRSDGAAVQRAAVLALACAVQEDSIGAFIVAGGMPLALECLADAEHDRVQGAAALLAATAMHPGCSSAAETRCAVEAAGGIQLLVRLLSSFNYGIQAAASCALCHFSAGGADNQALLLDADVAPSIVPLLAAGDSGVRSAAVSLLRNLMLELEEPRLAELLHAALSGAWWRAWPPRTRRSAWQRCRRWCFHATAARSAAARRCALARRACCSACCASAGMSCAACAYAPRGCWSTRGRRACLHSRASLLLPSRARRGLPRPAPASAPPPAAAPPAACVAAVAVAWRATAAQHAAARTGASTGQTAGACRRSRRRRPGSEQQPPARGLSSSAPSEVAHVCLCDTSATALLHSTSM